MKVVIIGGGTAGISVATHLRRLDENVRIVVLEKNDEFATAACGLVYYLSGLIKEKDSLVGATVEQMHRVFKIDVRLKHEVVSIDTKEKKLTIDGHPGETYDKLVIATGALQLRPDIPGILGENIFTIRDLSSVGRIKDYFYGTGAKKVVILGGGDIGVEAAEAFAQMGAEVFLLEAGAHVLPRFDADIAAIVQNRMRENNINLYLKIKVKEFSETAVILEDGRKIPFDMAIVAAGIKPDVKLPIMADLPLGANGGIKVNRRMQTKDESIYACGDNVETPVLQTRGSRLGGNASIAVKQARVVAENLAGHEEEFKPVLGTSAVRLFGLSVVMSGSSEEFLRRQTGKLYHKIHLWQNNYASYIPGNEKMLFKVMFASDGHILGIEGIGGSGVDKRVDVVSSVMHHHGTYKEMMSAEIAYSPFFATAKDAVNNMGSMIEGVVRDGVKYVFIESLDWSQAGREIMLIDTRSHEAFRGGHLPGAVNLPLADFRKHLSFVPRDKMVVLYCNSGYGAYNAYCLLAHHGYDNIYLLSGSLDLYAEIMADKEN